MNQSLLYILLPIEIFRSCAGKRLYHNKLWFRSRKFTTLKGITPRHAKGNSFTHNLSQERNGRRCSRPAELTYRIPATHPLQCRKPLVNSKQTDLTPSVFDKSPRQRQKKGNYNWFQNLFCGEIERKARGQGPRRKGLGSVLKHVENSFCRERRATSFAAGRSRKRF